MAIVIRGKLEEVLRADVPSFEHMMFRAWLDTGEIYGQYQGPYGFTSPHIMVRGRKVNIMGSKTGQDYIFTLPQQSSRQIAKS